MIKFSFILLLCILSASAAYGADGAEDAYMKAKACYGALKAKPPANTDPAAWERCMGMFERVERKYASSDKAPLALFNAAKLRVELYGRLHRESDALSAIKFFNQLVKQYPESSLADDALVEIGRLRLNPLKDKIRAKRAFDYIIETYPDGDMAAKAKEELAAMNPSAREAALPGTVAEKTVSANVPSVEEESIKAAAPFSGGVAGPESEALITKVDVKNTDRDTSVAFILTKKASYSLKFTEEGLRTKSPPELKVVLAYTRPAPGIARELNVSSPYLKSFKMTKGILKGGVHMTFVMMPGSSYEIASKSERFILRFKLADDKGTALAPAQSTATVDVKAGVKGEAQKEKTTIIVIDPGHGGTDTGAIGKGGIKEKDIVLSISKKLAAKLKNETGANVYLTRTIDKTLTLEERDAFAVSKKADIFISVHANASTNRKQAGIETYYLNNASDAAAAKLAKRENASAGKKLSDVEHILSTMLQNYDAAESELLAADVQRSLVQVIGGKYKGVKNRKVRSALFYVLVGAKCPAILVETSFISNPIEEKRLKNAAYQTDMAEAITSGVKKYLSLEGKRSVSL